MVVHGLLFSCRLTDCRMNRSIMQAPKSATWSSGEVVVQRRAALLDCLDTAKASYR